MSERLHPEPVAAAPRGELEPSDWLLELGAASRTLEFRVQLHSDQGRPLRAWSSRRAGARARRQLVQQALAAVGVPLGGDRGQAETPEPVHVVSPPPGPIAPIVVAAPPFVPAAIMVEPALPGETPPAAGGEPLADPGDPEDQAEPLLSRIGAYSVKPPQISVH